MKNPLKSDSISVWCGFAYESESNKNKSGQISNIAVVQCFLRFFSPVFKFVSLLCMYA